MKLCTIYWHRIKKTGEMKGGIFVSYKTTKEAIERIKKSYKSMKFDYMTDDPSLEDICKPIIEEGYARGIRDYGDKSEDFEVIIDYPEDIVVDCGGIILDGGPNIIELAKKLEFGGEEE